ELWLAAVVVDQMVGRLGDVGGVDQYRERPGQRVARPRFQKFVVELLLARREIVAFDVGNAGHLLFLISILRSRRRGPRRCSAQPSAPRTPCRPPGQWG